MALAIDEARTLRLSTTPQAFARVSGLADALAEAAGVEAGKLRTWPRFREALRRVAERQERAPDASGLRFLAEPQPLQPGQRRQRLKVGVSDPALYVEAAAAAYVRGRNVVEAPIAVDDREIRRLERDAQGAGVPARAVPAGPDEPGPAAAAVRAILKEAEARTVEGQPGDGFVAAFRMPGLDRAVLLMGREPVRLAIAPVGAVASDEDLRIATAKAVKAGYVAPYSAENARRLDREASEAMSRLNDRLNGGGEQEASNKDGFDFGSLDEVTSTSNAAFHANMALMKRVERKEAEALRRFAWAAGPAWSRLMDLARIERRDLAWVNAGPVRRGRQTATRQSVRARADAGALFALMNGSTGECARRFNQMAALSPFVATGHFRGYGEEIKPERIANLMARIASGDKLENVVTLVAANLGLDIHGVERQLNGRQLRTLALLDTATARQGGAPALQFCRDNPAGPPLPPRDVDNARQIDSAYRGVSAISFDSASAMMSTWVAANGRLGPGPSGRKLVKDFSDVVSWTAKSLRQIGVNGKGSVDLCQATLALLHQPDQRLGSRAEISERWHRRAPRLEAELASLEGSMKRDAMPAHLKGVEMFPHMLREAKEVADVTMTPLRSDEALIREGREMRHCVGSYREGAARGESMIVSLKGPDRTRSTAEIGLRRNRGDGRDPHYRLEVRQHRSEGNGDPDYRIDMALGKVLADANSDQPRLAELAKAMQRAAEVQAALERVEVPGLRAAKADLSFRQLQEAFPRVVKGQTREEFLQSHLPQLVRRFQSMSEPRRDMRSQTGIRRDAGLEMGA